LASSTKLIYNYRPGDICLDLSIKIISSFPDVCRKIFLSVWSDPNLLYATFETCQIAPTPQSEDAF